MGESDQSAGLSQPEERVQTSVQEDEAIARAFHGNATHAAGPRGASCGVCELPLLSQMFFADGLHGPRRKVGKLSYVYVTKVCMCTCIRQ